MDPAATGRTTNIERVVAREQSSILKRMIVSAIDCFVILPSFSFFFLQMMHIDGREN
jgi:hypothetical protein